MKTQGLAAPSGLTARPLGASPAPKAAGPVVGVASLALTLVLAFLALAFALPLGTLLLT